jgi:hypothetical protein
MSKSEADLSNVKSPDFGNYANNPSRSLTRKEKRFLGFWLDRGQTDNKCVDNPNLELGPQTDMHGKALPSRYSSRKIGFLRAGIAMESNRTGDKQFCTSI